MSIRTPIAGVPFSLWSRKDLFMKNRKIETSTIAAMIGVAFIVLAAIITIVNGAIYGTTKIEPPVSTQTSPKTETKTKTEKETIPYQTSTVEDSNLEYGKTETRTKGVIGEITYTYKITYTDGKETSRELISKETTKQPVNEVIAKGTKIVWHCVDATSYDRNAYNDNRCTSSTGEVRYVSDSQSIALDPTYSPGKYGAPYYNNK